MKLLTYRRGDDTQTVGVWRDDLNGPYDLLRALEIYAAASDESLPIMTDMIDLLDEGLVEPVFLGEVDRFVAQHDLLSLLSDASDFKILAPIARPRAIYALGRNYPVVMGITVIISVVVVIVNLLVDVLYAYIDPRIRLG